MPGDLEIADGRIAGYGLRAPNGRGLAVPGFIDLQVNGVVGVDFLGSDADGYRRAGAALLTTGVTSYLPTFITAPEEQLVAALHSVPSVLDGPRILGVHLEGPLPLRCAWESIPRPRGVTPTWVCSNGCSRRGRSGW